LTVVYSAECKAVQKEGRTGLLPVLIVLFVFSYVILTALVVEQGRTIEVQRGLIHEMLRDSNQLAAMKAQAAREEALRQSASSAQSGSSQAGPTQTDRLGAPASSAKASGKDGKPAGKSRPMKEAPGRPASDLQDVRRLTNKT